MLSTSRQKAKAMRSREIDILSDYDNMDVMLVGGDITSIERELAQTIKGAVSHNITEASSHPRGNSSQTHEEMDSLMNMIHSQNHQAKTTTISDWVIPEIQKYYWSTVFRTERHCVQNVHQQSSC